MTKCRSGEIQGCTGTTSRREFSVFSLLLIPAQIKCSKTISLFQLPGGCDPWKTAWKWIHLSPSQLWGAGTWTLWCLLKSLQNLSSMPAPPQFQLRTHSPSEGHYLSSLVLWAVQRQFWDSEIPNWSLCVQMLSEEVFPFPDITDFYNNPPIRCFLCQAAPWEVGCSGKQLPEHWALLTQSRSHKGSGAHGTLIPMGSLVFYNIPAWEVHRFLNSGSSPHSQLSFPLQPQTSNSCQVESLDYGFIIFLANFPCRWHKNITASGSGV